ncbi:hypothetical protein Tco_0980908, partial [Tanacetum coccineum]
GQESTEVRGYEFPSRGKKNTTVKGKDLPLSGYVEVRYDDPEKRVDMCNKT